MKIRRALVRALLAAAAIAVVTVPGSTAWGQKALGRALPRVYVFTDVAKPGEPIPPGQQERRASVDDLRAELRKKPGVLQVADIPLEADVLVQVLRREPAPGGRCLLTVRIRAAAQSTGREFQGEGPDWKEAAALVAEAVRRWVNETFDPAPI